MIKDVAKELLPPMSPIARWRVVMAAMVVLLALHAVKSDGFLQFIGITGYARASDVETVKGELQKQIKDVDTKVEAVNRKVDATNQSVETILKLQLQTRLRSLQEEKCGNHQNERLRRLIERELDELQNQHVMLTGYTYQIEEC